MPTPNQNLIVVLNTATGTNDVTWITTSDANGIEVFFLRAINGMVSTNGTVNVRMKLKKNLTTITITEITFKTESDNFSRYDLLREITPLSTFVIEQNVELILQPVTTMAAGDKLEFYSQAYNVTGV